MKGRFSKEELYNIRNKIPIDFVIRTIARLQCKLENEIFRFACPVCGGFNTATNPHTNLARCFGCKRNLNTIDIVMLVTGSAFVPSVLSLKKCRSNIHSNSTTTTRDSGRMPQSSQPQLVKDILAELCR